MEVNYRGINIQAVKTKLLNERLIENVSLKNKDFLRALRIACDKFKTKFKVNKQPLYKYGEIRKNIHQVLDTIYMLYPLARPQAEQDDVNVPTYIKTLYNVKKPPYDEEEMHQASRELLQNDDIGPLRWNESITKVITLNEFELQSVIKESVNVILESIKKNS